MDRRTHALKEKAGACPAIASLATAEEAASRPHAEQRPACYIALWRMRRPPDSRCDLERVLIIAERGCVVLDQRRSISKTRS